MNSPSSEAAGILRCIARTDGTFTVKAAINAAYRRVSTHLPTIKRSRIEDIWHERAKTIRAEEMDAIREAALKAKKDEARHEYSGVVQDIKRLEALVDLLANNAGLDVDALLQKDRPHHRSLGR